MVKVQIKHGHGVSVSDVIKVIESHVIFLDENPDIVIVVDRPLGFATTIAAEIPTIFVTWNRCATYKLDLIDRAPAAVVEGINLLSLNEIIEAVNAGESGIYPLVKTPLTPRQRITLQLLAKGKSNKVIADELGTSERTVKNYIYECYDKLKLESRIHATHYYYGNWHLIENWHPPTIGMH